MDIWIIQDGEKIGPIHDYEIRSRIGKGELPPTTPAWHEGLPAWKPLVEISLFEREFDHPAEHQDSPYAPPAAEPFPPVPPPARPALVRRFFARWFDLSLYPGIWWILMWVFAADIEAMWRNPWFILLLYNIPWIGLETFLLHRFGTTPGKWLLDLRVTNDDASHLSLKHAAKRSVQVLFFGLGLGWGPLTLICLVMSYFSATRFGRPLWDRMGGHRVVSVPLRPIRIVSYVFVLCAVSQLQWMVVAPYILPKLVEDYPALREMLEKNPPLQLPPRR